MTSQIAAKVVQELGAIPISHGVSFRVWAPHADRVSVVGPFNDWHDDAHLLTRESDGNWSVEVEAAKAGDEYKFVLWNGAQRLERIDPRARQVTNSVGNGIICQRDFDWQGDAFTIADRNQLVVYEMHIGTFHKVGDAVGTFDTACEKLAYLKELGINAIEIMPVAEFAGDYSWGYNPAHPYAIETAYGGCDGLRRFIREAHRHGIAVLIDVVYNHFGPSDLGLWRFDGWSQNNLGGIYFYNDWRSSTPWGDTRPDYGRGEVRQYIYDNAMMWLDDYHADGLRYDMTLYMRSVDGNEQNVIPEGFSLAQWINREALKRFPHKVIVAEDLRNNALMTARDEHGGANFSSQWDAKFVHPVRATITAIDDGNRSMQSISDALCWKYNHDAFERVVYTESHDEVANGKQHVVSEIDPSDDPGRFAVKRSTLGAALVFTAPGIPMLMQGQEFLRDKWFDDKRPIDWQRAEKYSGIVKLYRDMIRLRLNLDGHTAGLMGQHLELVHVSDLNKVIAFRRFKEGGLHDDTLVVMNFAEGAKQNYRIGFPQAGTWNLYFNSDWKGYSEKLDGTHQLSEITVEPVPYDGQPFSAALNIGAYTCHIFAYSRVVTDAL